LEISTHGKRSRRKKRVREESGEQGERKNRKKNREGRKRPYSAKLKSSPSSHKAFAKCTRFFYK
jgi:hypothetical protein